MALPGFKATAVDGSGNTLGATSVEVRLQSDNSLATLYSDKDGTTPITNPFNAAANGDFEFYSAQGAYTVTLGAGTSPQVFPVDLVNADSAQKTYLDFGAAGDGVVDDTAALVAIKDYCTATGNAVDMGAGKTFLTEQWIANAGENIFAFSSEASPSIILLKAGEDNNAVQATGDTSKVVLENLIVDQNRANNLTAGHGVRCGGCAKLHLRNVEIRNCRNYGVGFQAGTARDVLFENIYIHDTGLDAIDIKDFDSANEVVRVYGGRFEQYGLDSTQQVALDVRGEIDAHGLTIVIQGNNRGFRNRPSGPQGRAGFGAITGFRISSDGLGTSIALDITGDDPDFVVSSGSIKNVDTAISTVAACVGGTVSNVSASEVYGTNSMVLQGTDVILSGIRVTSTAASTRILDVLNATNIQLGDFLLDDNAAGGTAVRIQASSNDFALQDGVIRGGTVGNSGTATIQSNVRLL